MVRASGTSAQIAILSSIGKRRNGLNFLVSTALDPWLGSDSLANVAVGGLDSARDECRLFIISAKDTERGIGRLIVPTLLSWSAMMIVQCILIDLVSRRSLQI
jgi:hypothetical protein